jgi:hypothetical protein
LTVVFVDCLAALNVVILGGLYAVNVIFLVTTVEVLPLLSVMLAVTVTVPDLEITSDVAELLVYVTPLIINLYDLILAFLPADAPDILADIFEYPLTYAVIPLGAPGPLTILVVILDIVGR